MAWRIIESEGLSAQEVMDKDFDLLRQLKSDDNPIIHHYEFLNPSLTYGYFTDVSNLLNLQTATESCFDLGRRPTGGGVIFHHCDLAFSILIPSSHALYSINTMENYAAINLKVASVLKRFQNLNADLLENESKSDTVCQHFCMGKPTLKDVMIEGKKVSGGAQRRKKNGFLHQGTIALSLPNQDDLSAIVHHGDQVLQAMFENSFPLMKSSDSLDGVKTILRQLLVDEFTKDQ